MNRIVKVSELRDALLWRLGTDKGSVFRVLDSLDPKCAVVAHCTPKRLRIAYDGHIVLIPIIGFPAIYQYFSIDSMTVVS